MLKTILEMDNVTLIHKNFSGEPNKFNREGDRNFGVIIDDPEQAQLLLEDGWNIKVKAPREEGDLPLHYMSVKVKFNKDYPRLNPNVYVKTGTRMNRLDEETIGQLDDIDMLNVQLDIRPYNYDVNGKTGVTAYVQSMCVTQKITDRFRKEYDDGRE